MSIDRLTLGILGHYFRAAAEAMGHVLQRTAHTTFIKESNDFGTALVTPEGEQFAYAVSIGTQGFVGLDYGHLIRELGPWEEGDIAIANCPYLTQGVASHLPDYQMIKPIFAEGRIVAFVWGFLHASDMGGIVAASILPGAYELYQEGLRIPPVKLFRRGVLQEDVKKFLLVNVRIPEKNWGDLNALHAALGTGEERIRRAIDKWGLATFEACQAELIGYAEARARDLIRRIPERSFHFVDYLEDDVVSDMPIRFSVRMTREGDGVHLDFTGTDPQVSAAFNLASNGRHPYLCLAMFGYFRSIDPGIPVNAGLMRPIRFTAPEGSVVNATFPASCGVRFALAQTVYGVVQSLLAQALPGEVPAIGAGQAAILAISLMDPAKGRRQVTVVQPMIGGSGGRLQGDGIDGCDFSQGALANTPVESIENEVPILVREYSVVPDSAGPGRFRGGLAFRLDFQVFHPDTIVTARGMERFRFQPWGFAGGRHGTSGDCRLDPGTAGERNLGKLNSLKLEAGNVLSVRTPGGGGYGDPWTRAPEAVLEDVCNGVVSIERARIDYGVVVVHAPSSGSGESAHGGRVDQVTSGRLGVDEAATQALRAGRPPADLRPDPGPGRAAHERVFSFEVAEAMAELLYSLPSGLRYYAKTRLYERIRALAAAGETVTAATVAGLRPQLLQAMGMGSGRSIASQAVAGR
jgi:N-methylhydantoinase B